jgi:putative flippase GtrA/phosphoserine phosphatase
MELVMNVYDFDGTIYDGDVSIDFFLFTLRTTKRPWLALPRIFSSFLGYFLGRLTIEELKQAFFSLLKYLDDVDEHLEKFWKRHESKIKQIFFRPAGEMNVIITASPEFLVSPVYQRLGYSYLIGTIFDLKSFKILGNNCEGIEKVTRLKLLFPNSFVTNKFYSDSTKDKPLADIAEEAYYVKGSEILEWSEIENQKKNPIFSIDFLRFVFVGGIGTLVNFIVSVTISNVIDPVVSYAIAYGISIGVTYTLDSKLVFKRKLSIARFLRFLISYLPNFILSFGFVAVFINLLGVNRILVYGFVSLLGLPITFVIVKLFAFGKGE